MCLVSRDGRAGDRAHHPPNPHPHASVFYEEHHDDMTWVGDELELLRHDQVRVPYFAPVAASTFEWEHDSFTDYSWWMEMQELRFLLPAMASSAPADQRIARAWFMRWYAVHMIPEPAVSAWGEPMTVGYRAMVLVRLLASEEGRPDADSAVVSCLRATIRAHQRDLARPERFSAGSNHGFIVALGLFETTRAIPDTSITRLALQRIDVMMKAAVSAGGVEVEHSPAYHFVVMDWLDQIAAYFATLDGAPQEFVPRIRAVLVRMRAAAYFLHDNDGLVPAIGDTDSLRVEVTSTGITDSKSQPALTLYDPAAGIAVYKGRAGDCRYVVFSIPGENPGMRSHAHDDALSVYFSHAGEIILGDAGRYEYGGSPERGYMVSAAAHNTMLTELPPNVVQGQVLRGVSECAELPDHGTNGWTARLNEGGSRWKRTVEVPVNGDELRIVDALEPESPTASATARLIFLWHLGGDVTGVGPAVSTGDGRERAWTFLTRRGQRVRLVVRADGAGPAGIVETKTVRGQLSPRLGWYSPSQHVLRPVTTLIVQVRRSPTLTVTTDVQIEQGPCVPTGPSSGSGDP